MHPTADDQAASPGSDAAGMPWVARHIPTVDDVAVFAATDGAALARFACGLGLAADDAEDCAQEAFARLWRAVDVGETIFEPRAWAYRVVYRLAMDVHRRRRRAVDARLLAGREASGQELDLDALIVGNAVDWLPSRRRQVLHLRYRSGLRFEEIATMLAITSSAARSHATQALAQLRERLGDEPGVPGLPNVPAPPSAAVRRGGWWEETGRLGSVPGGLLQPAGLDVDPRGRIWVVEAGRDQVAVFDADGGFLARWGRPGSAPGELSFRRPLGPVGDIRFRRDGGFYIADNGNKRVQRFDAEGRFVSAWGSPGHGPGDFLDPWSVRLDTAGRVYVSDALRNDVQVFTPEGVFLHAIGRAGSGRGQLDFQGDALVVGDELLVADHANRRISLFGLDGAYRATRASGLLAGPDGLDAGPDGTLIVGDTRARRLVVLDAAGRVVQSWPGRPWMLRRLPDGRLLTSEFDRVRIHRYVPAFPTPGR